MITHTPPLIALSVGLIVAAPTVWAGPPVEHGGRTRLSSVTAQADQTGKLEQRTMGKRARAKWWQARKRERQRTSPDVWLPPNLGFGFGMGL